MTHDRLPSFGVLIHFRLTGSIQRLHRCVQALEANDEYQLDLALAQWIYAQEGHQWALKEHWLFSTVLHQRGREFSIALLLLCLALLLTSGIWSLALCWCCCALLAALMLTPTRNCSTHPATSMIQLNLTNEPLPHASALRSTGR